MVIYKATNNITEESYIGYATNGLKDRKRGHKNSANREDGYYFQHAIKKYGWDNFRWILLEHSITDFEILKELERYWIREFGTKKPNGYNLTEGGDGVYGYKHSKETKRKLSEANKGKSPSKETKRKLCEAGRNRKLSEEHKRKIGEAHKGKSPSEETRMKLSEANKGKKLSKEVRKRLSEKRKGEKNSFYGKHHTEETRKKISEAKKGKKLSEEHKRKISEARKILEKKKGVII